MNEKRPIHTVFVTDLHYTGTDEIDPKTGTAWKYRNNYTAEYDMYGWTSDKKVDEVITQLIDLHKRNPIDMLFFLGDAAMNDGCYKNYCEQLMRYDTWKRENPEWIYGEMDDFFKRDCKDNASFLVKDKFFDRLTAAGIPYVVANGNHDYCMRLRADERERPYLDYSAWEGLYHYKELFGYGETTFPVEILRRDGKTVIFTYLSDERLAEFHKNGYTYYVNDRRDSDEKCAIFLVGDGFTLETFLRYLYFGAPYGMEVWSFACQTFRYQHLDPILFRKMAERCEGYPAAYITGHLIGSREKCVVETIEKYGVQAILYGDTHTDKESRAAGDIPDWCCTHFASPYDVDTYTLPDGSFDEQYNNSRGPRHTIWGDFSRHPWGYVEVFTSGDRGTLERVRAPFFYENGAQVRLTFDRVTGCDVRYRRYFENGVPVFDENGDKVFVDENGRPVYRHLLLDENGEATFDYFYVDRSGAFIPIDLSKDAVYTGIKKNYDMDEHHKRFDKATVGDIEPVIEVKDGKFVRGEGWVHFAYRKYFTYADGSPATPAPDLDESGNPVYGLSIPAYHYHKTNTDSSAKKV